MATAAEEIIARNRVLRAVRARMRDYAELNRLVDGEESGDRAIMMAIRLAMSLINHTPPPLGVKQVYQVPLHLLVELTAAYLIDSVGLLALRNDMNFATGSTSVQLPQASTYPQVAARMFASAKADLAQWKVSQNLQAGLDAASGVSSSLLLLTAPSGAYDYDLHFAA